MTIRVRPATAREYVAAGVVCVEAYRADGQLSEDNGYAEVLADVEKRAAHAEIIVAVDDDHGGIVGCVTFAMAGSLYAELSCDGEAEFRMLSVDPRAQGRGVGKALVRACVDRAGQLGRSALVICSRDFNTRAMSLYASFGFKRASELDWSPYPGVNLLAMRLDLPALSEAQAARAI